MIAQLASLIYSSRLVGWLALFVYLSVATLTWYTWHAASEWRRSATLLAGRRADHAADLLVSSMARDMRGAQGSVLSSPQARLLRLAPPHETRHLIASAFARYPYPELFFGWRGIPTPQETVFFSRNTRRPAWISRPVGSRSFPVIVTYEPVVAGRLIDRVMVDARRNLDFSFFDLTIEGTPYQVVSHVFRSSPAGAAAAEPVGVLGFLVNMEWARTHYFLELVQQVERVVGADAGLTLGVLDAGGAPVVRAQPHTHGGPIRQRVFSLAFFDPLLAVVSPSTDLLVESWRVEVTAGNDPALRAANRGARQTLIIATVAAVVLALGLIQTTRAAREHARLAQMRSDFVSAVTHELKTPIAAIRALGHTLISGRLPDAARSREYAELVVEEAKRLTRLVDNLLAYAQITDTTQAYAFAPLAVEDLVRQSLGEYARKLEGFDVRVGLPADLPPVRADPTAIGLMLDNLLDNAIRYSTGARRIKIGARHEGRTLTLEITDKGIGIPSNEVGRVTRKGFRGRGSELGGSGLGLAIVQRIVDDHGGRLAITSATGKGTSIFVTLPVADDDHDETHSPG